MTLEELADTLPNGLHDAQVSRISLDYLKREARFTLDVWVGDSSSQDEEMREAYRSGELKLSGLLYCAIEPPDASYPYAKADKLWVDAGALESANVRPTVKLPEPLPEVAFACWFFVQGWNSYIYVGAMEASLAWAE
ncbi:MAG TPA: hypothetical protein VIQ24_11770 [Pyrinomonadaceae bacterium]